MRRYSPENVANFATKIQKNLRTTKFPPPNRPASPSLATIIPKKRRKICDVNTAPPQLATISPTSLFWEKLQENLVNKKVFINFASTLQKLFLLHRDKDRMLLKLSDAVPKFFTAKILQEMGFEPSGEYYVGFEIKSLNPVTIDGLDIGALDLRREGKYSFRPYFLRLNN